MTYQLDEDTFVTLVRHDDARKMRLTLFGRKTWVLFLGFPLDYQTSFYINRVVDDFGLLSVWHQPRGNLQYVLVKVCLAPPN